MKKYIVFLLVLLSSCSSSQNEDFVQWMQPNGKVKVLCTIGMIEDVVSEVGGSYINTIVLVKGELDPHSYQLVKGDDEKLAVADLIFFNGLGLEHGPSLRQSLTNNSNAVGLGDWIYSKDPSKILTYNRSVDPHIWMDAALWAQTIEIIVQKLSEHDPEHADFYKQNGKSVFNRMNRVHNELIEVMDRVPEQYRYLVTSHDAFNYFARAYLTTDKEREEGKWQKRFAAPEGLSPESQLSTSDIRHILDHMKKYDVRVIFPESNVSQASIRKLLDAGIEEGMDLVIAPGPLYGDAMGEKGSSGDTYLKMITHNVHLIAKYLNRNGVKHERK